MNSTSFFYAHSNQWRYEKLELDEILSPLADRSAWENQSLIDCNVRAERMGWLPSAPQLEENPLEFAKKASKAGESSADYVAGRLKDGSLRMSCQSPDVKDWMKGECDPIPGKTMPNFIEVVRDFPDTYKKFTSLGPLMTKVGNGGKGIAWNTEDEVSLLGDLNQLVTEEGVSKGLPSIDTDIDAAEVVLTLAPETNGQVAVKAWEALGKITGRDHTHLALPKEDEKIRFRDIQAQPRKIISSPT